MLEILKNWVLENRRSAVVTLHDPALALECCDRLVLLKDRQVLGILHPASDPLPEMEMTLSRIYGTISLIKCPDRTGREHLVMLKEREELQ
jgi:iron complex transport system ATP-binding protein